MCDEGVRTGLPYVRQRNADGVAVCATRERGQGCRMCNKGTRTGLPYVRQGNADGVAVCATREHGQGCRMCERVVHCASSCDMTFGPDSWE